MHRFRRGFAGRVLAPSLLLLVILSLAAVLRLADLGNRPMHCDEAVNAIKFGQLLERGEYTYDPYEYHGPSLNYLTLPVARAASIDKLTDITEPHLRLVPAIFGIGLVGLVWLLRKELSLPAILFAAVLMAVSPAMVFYSRYYIHEMPLVFFTFGAIAMLLRYRIKGVRIKGGSKGVRTFFPTALAILGLCMGMMHASKETCVIPLFAMAVAAFVTAEKGAEPILRPWRWRSLARLLPVALVAGGISAMFFSSLLSNPRGILDSFATCYYYVVRAAGEGTTGPHVQAWDYYFRILFWWHPPGGPIWTEAAIGVLALVGVVAGITKKGLPQESVRAVRFLSVYTLIVILAYSLMPYKTPWCMLGMLHGMILLAGVGAAVLVRVMPGYLLKSAMVAILAAAVGHLAWQAHRASFVAYDDPTTPYVYAHTTSDVPVFCRHIEEIARCHDDGPAMHIQVICPNDDFWPLPWYLRNMTGIRWYSDMPQGPDGPLPGAPIIITQPSMETDLARHLYEDLPEGERPLYVPLPAKEDGQDWQLRPYVPLRVFVRWDFWETYEASP